MMAASLFSIVNTTVTLLCETTIYKPIWSGPPFDDDGSQTIYNYRGSDIRPDISRLHFASNNRDLVITGVQISDGGTYRCLSNTGQNLIVRVPPDFPIIYNTNSISKGELTVSGTEGTSLTLTCLSAGGHPQQTVNWFRESATSTPLQADPPKVVSGDLFNVTRSYTFTPISSDDGVTFICQSSYSGDPQLIRTTDVKLFLKLQPTTPIVTVIGTPAESSSSIPIAQCMSFGFRPHTVNLSWILSGGTAVIVGNPTVEESTTTNTFSVYDTYSKAVDRADNMKTLTCSINHETLSTPRTASVALNVQFPPTTATLTGTFTTMADGRIKTFTCESGSSNPDAYITWRHNNALITSGTGTSTNIPGEFNGRLTIQTLTITPTRDDDGDVYSCSARNYASSSSANSQPKTLNLTYHPIASVTCQSFPVTEGSKVSLSCTASSKPSSSLTWSHNSTIISTSQGPVASNVFNHVISSVNRTHYGRYTCTAQNGISPQGASSCNLEIKFPSLVTTISGNTSIVANGVNILTLICTSGSSNPASSFTWYLDGQQVISDEPVQESVGQYGGNVTSHALKLTPTRDMDGHVIKCRTINGLTGNSNVEAQVALDITYSPVATIVSRLETETQPGLLRCLVSSKPAATIKWYRINNEHTFLLDGTGKNSLDYRLGSVSRDDAGTYQCTANNGIGGDNSRTVQLVVQYKPDVTIIAQNATENLTSELQCVPHGEPDSYTFISWEHTWPGSSHVLRILLGSEILTLSDLRYEHTGIYRCRVDNGVKFSRNPSAGQGQVFFVVKSRPLVTTTNKTILKAAQLGEVATITVEFVSNIPGTEINVEKRRNDTVAQSTLFTTTTSSAIISVIVFSKTVQTEGFQSEINIMVMDQDDFGMYEIVIENSVGKEKRVVNLVSKGPPSPPYIISITHVTKTSALLTWTMGFHRGFDQTVKVETSRDGTSWTPTLSLHQRMLEDTSPINTTIDELLPASLYYLRMFSVNADGESSRTGLFKFTTKEDIIPNYDAVIGGVVGGSLGVVVAVIALVFFLRRKYTLNCSLSIKEDVHSIHNSQGAGNSGYNAALTYEVVSSAKDTPDYDALQDRKEGPNDPNVYMPLEDSSPRSHYEYVKREDPVYKNTVLNKPEQTVL